MMKIFGDKCAIAKKGLLQRVQDRKIEYMTEISSPNKLSSI